MLKLYNISSDRAMQRALNRFEKAINSYAFIGTIPREESDEAESYAASIEYEVIYSRKLLESLIQRRIRND